MASKKHSPKSALTTTTTTPASLEAQRAASPASSVALADAVHESLELCELAHRIQDALNSAAATANEPGNVRRLLMACEADLLRASIRLVNARAMIAQAGNAAHVAELRAMADEVKP
jgi:hypothetical protein